MLDRWKRALEEHIHANSDQMMREPAGGLTHPYIVPTSPDSPYYSTALWDWDSWFTSIVLGQVEADTDRRGFFFSYEEGSILNFLEHTDADGVMPTVIAPDLSNLPPDQVAVDPSTGEKFVHPTDKPDETQP